MQWVIFFKMQDVFPSVGVIQINVKRLIDEVRYGENLSVTREPLAEQVKSPDNAHFRNTPTYHLKNPVEFLRKETEKLKAKFKPAVTESSSQPIIGKELSASYESFPNPDYKEARSSASSASIVHSLFSIIMAWGINSHVDEMLHSLGIFTNPKSLSVGFRGFLKLNVVPMVILIFRRLIQNQSGIFLLI